MYMRREKHSPVIAGFKLPLGSVVGFILRTIAQVSLSEIIHEV
jgi:hypothetical protein